MFYRLAEAVRHYCLYLIVIGPCKMALVKSKRAPHRAETEVCRRADKAESRAKGKCGAGSSRRRRVYRRQIVPSGVTRRRLPERPSPRHPAPEGERHISLGRSCGPGAREARE